MAAGILGASLTSVTVTTTVARCSTMLLALSDARTVSAKLEVASLFKRVPTPDLTLSWPVVLSIWNALHS